jgi:putative MATE family efflux protein
MQLHKKQLHTHNILDSENVSSLLIKLAIPSFMGMFVQSFYNVINTIFMGKYVDSLAIAGLSIVFPVQMIMFGIAQMVGMGGSSLMSRFIGSQEIDKAEHTLANGLTAGLIMAAIYTAAILPFADFWLKLIGTSPEVMVYAKPYLMIVIGGTVINIMGMVLMAYTRAEGNTRVGMVAMVSGAILSIILDIIFVPVLHMGVIGAGLATVISQFLVMVYIFSYYLTGTSFLKIRLKNLRPKMSILKPIFSIGVAGFAQTAAGSISSILLINMIISYGGDTALSAYGILQRISMFVSMPAMVLGQAMQPILGFNYGARRYNLALKAIKQASVIASVASIIGFIIIYAIPAPLIRIFSSDPVILQDGIQAARLIFISMPVMGVMMVGQTIFQAVGQAGRAFTTAIVRPIVFLIPLVLIMSRLWNLEGVYLSFPTSDILTFFLTVGLTIPVLKRFRKIAAEQRRLAPDSPEAPMPFHVPQWKSTKNT